ncbi:MAG: hypothetical protein ACHQ53_10985, partial [Polyangiales bacterium]
MWRWALAISAATLAATARAQAGASLEEVLGVRPDASGCVTELALRRRVQRWLEPGPLESGVKIAVDAATEPVSFTVMRDDREVAQRRFEVLPVRCDDRLDALALALALALEREAGAALVTSPPDATSEGAAGGQAASAPPRPTEDQTKQATPPADQQAPKFVEQPKKAPTPPAPPAKPVSSEPRRDGEKGSSDRSSPRATAGSYLRLQAGAAVLLEVLPALAWAGSAGVQLVLDHYSFELSGLLTPATASSRGGVSARSQLIGSRALACLESTLSALGLLGCAGAEGGAVLASGRASAATNVTNSDKTVGWLAAALRAGVLVPAQGPVSVRLSVDALGNLLRPN